MKWNAENIFDVLVILFAGTFVIIALGYDLAPSRVPLAVGCCTLVLAIFHLVQSILKQRAGQVGSGDLKQLPQGPERMRLILFLAWLFGFFILTSILGLTWSIPIFLFTLLRFYFKESWLATTALTIGTWAVVYTLFAIIFEIDLYRGFLFG